MKKETNTIPVDMLRNLLRYDEDVGLLFWKERPVTLFKNGLQSAAHNCKAWNSKLAGKKAFSSHGYDGYVRGTIFGRRYYAHRVIWAMQTGKWPTHQIDHINHNTADNRIRNLREATTLENGWNQSIGKNNVSGVCGVSWSKAKNLWCATISPHGEKIHLGSFEELRMAAAARQGAERALGFHKNHGTVVLREEE